MDAAVIDSRRERGLLLAKSTRIRRLANGKWSVPSASEKGGGYIVDTEARTCTCPDHELRLTKCKHLWAVEYSRHQVVNDDGSKHVTETVRITYAQDWPAYNRAQCEEKDRIQLLLRSLCDGIVQVPQTGSGRRRMPLADVVYAATMKVFVGMSGRRATSDIRACEAKGLVGKAAHYNTVFEYLGKPELTPILKGLITQSAVPLRAIERQFAIDATGFSSSVYRRWFDAKYGTEQKEHFSVKLHIVTGVHTNVVVAAEASEGTLHDSPFLPGLLGEAAPHFDMREVSADKGYLGVKNLEAIEAIGARAFVPFKSNSQSEGPEVWRRLWHYYALHRADFLAHYHARSNVETTFSVIKRKFGSFVRSKVHEAMVNECLVKVLCHNLSCLVHSIHELGIEPKFWATQPMLVGGGQ